jgi:hypothetical protein
MTRQMTVAAAFVVAVISGLGLWAAGQSIATAGGQPQVLQISFKYTGSRSDYERIVTPAVVPLAKVEGLRWKIWIINEATHEAGGIYLFADKASVQRFLASDLVAGVKSNPALSSFSVTQSAVMMRQTVRTRGPVEP